MADDVLKPHPVNRVAAWYRRLADGWQRNAPELQPSLAAVLLRTWLDNRDPSARIHFDAPSHLKSNSTVISVQQFHRDVFLTNKKARFAGGKEKWAGVMPRIQGSLGFAKWDMKGELPLQYESLCDPAPNIVAIAKVQRFGTSGERDVFGSLRGFQLKSEVVVTATPSYGNTVTVRFKSWSCSGTDRYDWNYSEYLTLANPDFGSTDKDAIAPESETVRVYHSNAKRLEDAKLAAPYDVILRPWMVVDRTLVREAPSTEGASSRVPDSLHVS